LNIRYIQIGVGGSRQSAAIGTDNRASGGKAAPMAIISDDLVTDLRSLRGTELERTVHDAIKVGIDDALTKNIAPVMVGYEAMAQGLAILTGADLDQSKDALLNVIKDLGAQLSQFRPLRRHAHDCRFRSPIGSGLAGQ
jgi:hypothetical protein